MDIQRIDPNRSDLQIWDLPVSYKADKGWVDCEIVGLWHEHGEKEWKESEECLH